MPQILANFTVFANVLFFFCDDERQLLTVLFPECFEISLEAV